MRRRKPWWTLLLVAVLACGSGSERDSTVVADPSGGFTSLEERLLTAQTVRLDYRVTATGAVEAELVGALEIEGESILRVTGVESSSAALSNKGLKLVTGVLGEYDRVKAGLRAIPEFPFR